MFKLPAPHSVSARGLGVLTLAAAALLALPSAQAGIVGPWTRASSVSDVVVDNGNGTWTYNYVVKNRSFVDAQGTDFREPIIVDWELPWFGDAGITDIMSPINWAYSIETIGVANESTGWEGVADWQTPGDPFHVPGSVFNSVTQVLHWYNVCWAQRRAQTVQIESGTQAVAICEFEFDNAIFPETDGDGGELGGFSFVAAFDEVPAPYQASWANLPVQTGDPAFPLGGIPNSPAVSANGVVPEPAPLLLLALAAGIAAYAGRRRQV